MAEITLESLVARIEALEKKLAALDSGQSTRKKDWRRVVGTMEDDEFTRAWEAEVEAQAEAERLAAQSEPSE